MRIAWLSPLPPMASGIADYSYDLLPLIARRADVDVVCPAPRRRGRLQVPEGVTWIEPEAFAARGYDAVFHHLGNNPLHEFVHEWALARPGVAVFHDFVMHHLVDHMTAQGPRDPVRYRRMLEREYGDTGRALSRLRFAKVHSEFEKFLWPMSGHLARASRALVAHSEYVREQLEDVAPGVPVTVIRHYAQRPPPSVAGVGREEARRRLRLPRVAFLVGHFGFVTRPKQPAAVLGGFASLLAERPDALLLLVGADHTGGALPLLSQRYGLEGHVVPTGFVDLELFSLYLRAVDAVINLRYPSAGESSGTVTRAMTEGRAVIVNDVASFAELPRDVALKVEVDGDQREQVGAHLRRLAEDPAFRERLERAAHDYAATELDPERAADAYVDVARRVAAEGATQGRVGRVNEPARAVTARWGSAPALPEVRGGADPGDPANALPLREQLAPFVDWLTGQTLPPSGAGVALDVVYRLLLRRPVEEAALRSSLLSLAAGDATRADLVRWVVESREFREIELVEKRLNRIRLAPGPWTVAREAPEGAGTTERVVEIPWVLSRYAGEPRVLDLGYAFASGYYLTALTGLRIPELHGVDWSAAPVPAMLRTRADLRALPYRDGVFDAVLCISTIEHVGLDNTRYGMTPVDGASGAEIALREAARVLRPGGRLLITVPFGAPMDESWFVQFDTARWERLIAATTLRETERALFHLTEHGWMPVEDVESAERLLYGVNAPAARAVLCAELRTPA